MTADAVPRVHLLVPIKPLHRAKSRLLGALDGDPTRSHRHAELVTAVALDTVTEAARAAHVAGIVAVTSDAELTASLNSHGIEVLPDAAHAGLNEALRHGEHFLHARGPGTRVGALQADLPALRADELDAALVEAGPDRAFCPDRHGTGTTLLVAEPSGPLAPHFGVDSATRHEKSGARRVRGRVPSLTCDVDTDTDLRLAAELGLGPRTRACLDHALGEARPRAGVPSPACRPRR